MISQALPMKCLAAPADTMCRPKAKLETSNQKLETGNTFWFCLPVASFPDPQTQAQSGGNGMIGEEIVSVLSETDQLREQLLRAQRLSSVGTLASSVAHEFNNILTTIINYAKLGLRPDCPDATRAQ